MDELVEHWTVLDDELQLVAGKRGGTRLGFALLLTPAEQAEVLDLLDVRVTLLGDVPSRKSKDDQVAQWFRANGGVVPTLTDEAWAKAEPVFTGPSAGRPTRPPRLMLEALLHKAVSRCSWREIGEQYGPWATVASTWRRWNERGVWAEGMELLAGMPGTPIPPEEIALPPIRVEGRLDPRLLVPHQTPHGPKPSSGRPQCLCSFADCSISSAGG
ncbi:transposase, partial [Streptomyces sp. NPDC053726]